MLDCAWQTSYRQILLTVFLTYVHEVIERFKFQDKATAQTSKLAGCITTTAKIGAKKVLDNTELADPANEMVQKAQRAADILGVIAMQRCAFQLVGLCVKFLCKRADSNHGSLLLPKLLEDLTGYLGIISTCLKEALETRWRFYRGILKKICCIEILGAL